MAFTFPVATVAAIPFTDVEPADWFYTAVDHLYSWGVVQDSENNKFRPDKNINRAETAVMFDRYNDYIKTQFAPLGSSGSLAPANNLEIMNHSLKQEDDEWVLTGTIRNRGRSLAKIVQAIAVFYDKAGKRLSIIRMYAEPMDLDPGQEGVVEGSISPLDKYDHYTLEIYE